MTLIENSRLKDTQNIFDKENYFLPIFFDQEFLLEGKTFDAIIVSEITSENIFEKQEIVIKKSIQDELDKKDLSEYEKLCYLLENYSCFYYPVLQVGHILQQEVLNRPITFTLHKECNANCEYCNQACGRPYKTFSDDEIYERFDEAVTKMEELYNFHFKPEIIGGEPTIWSEYLINKIIKRLDKYETIFVMTNHIVKTSAWEKSSKVIFLNHIIDWTKNKKIEPKANTLYTIVVTHKDIRKLDEFLEVNNDALINIDEYVGDNEDFLLTEDDWQYFLKLCYKYSNVQSNISQHFYLTKNNYSNEHYKKCIKLANPIIIDCNDMTVVPCCNLNQKRISLTNFNKNLPELERCKDCKIALREFNYR